MWNGGVKSGVLEVNFSRCSLPLSPKSPFGGQIGVLEVLFGAVRNFLTNNDQQLQIKAVLSIFENSQRWTPHLSLGFWLSCAQIACFGPKIGSYGVIFWAEHVFWPKNDHIRDIKAGIWNFHFFQISKKFKRKNDIFSILGRLDQFLCYFYDFTRKNRYSLPKMEKMAFFRFIFFEI